MNDLTVTLPTLLRQFVDARIGEGGYDDAGHYISDLIRKDQQRRGVDELLLAGLQSGEPTTLSDEWWERKQAKFVARDR